MASASGRELQRRAPAPPTHRSYRYPYALVASHSEPVGVDVERIEPFDEAFLESILTPSERRAGVSDANPDRCVASLSSSKEALAKALGDATRHDPAAARLAHGLGR